MSQKVSVKPDIVLLNSKSDERRRKGGIPLGPDFFGGPNFHRVTFSALSGLFFIFKRKVVIFEEGLGKITYLFFSSFNGFPRARIFS